MEKYYLAYGSNLNLKQMKERCPTAKPIFYTYLKDYRLVFKGPEKGLSYLTLEKCEGETVPIGIFKIDFIAEARLDMYEGYPNFYNKKYIEVEYCESKINALIYIMNDIYSYNIPSQEYLSNCIDGYQDFEFDIKYLNNALTYTINNLEKKLIK